MKQEDIIVVTFNYRLGALGFLDWSYFNENFDYNNGLSDQINVLKWVHLNIESFGVDPENITLMDQSAGSMSIMALMQMPEFDTYYHKVMLLSGTLNCDTQEIARLKAQHFSKLVTTYYSQQSVAELTSLDLLTLMDT